MGPVSGLVLYAVIWTLCFLVALPIRVQTQGDLDDVVPGTHAGAPEPVAGKRALQVAPHSTRRAGTTSTAAG